MSTKKVIGVKNQRQPEKNQNLQVFVRCRPFNEYEANQRSDSVVDFPGPKDLTIQDRCNSKLSKMFSFDKVFGPTSSQVEIYQTVVEPMINDVLAGFNCTVFAYGPTGSGKTFTMEGELSLDPMSSENSKSGVIPRAMCALFDELHVLQAEYTVRISFTELYNEELYDLLSPDEVPPKLRLFDDASKKGSVIIQGLQEVMVHTQTQVLEELFKGCAKRQTAATLLNAQSSRSHTIFCVTVHTKENSVDGEELLKTGKLYLVDLAGSENVARSGATDKRAREAGSINQSLLTLGRVITCLVDRHPHVPYRESKLTRLLQDSIGGRTKTSMIATISPAFCCIEDTLTTLDYAHRAKSVLNKPEINQKVSQKVVMKEYMDLIEDLKKKLDLHRTGCGVYLNDANYKQIIEETREKSREITEKIAAIRVHAQKLKTLEETFHSLSTIVRDQQLNLENTEKSIEKKSEEIQAATEVLTKVSNEKEEVQDLLSKVEDQENKLRSQAEHLIDVVDSSRADSDKIFKRLDQSSSVVQKNNVYLQQIKEKFKFLDGSGKKMYGYLESAQEMLDNLCSAAETVSNQTKIDSSLFINEIHQIKKFSVDSLKKVQSLTENVVLLSKINIEKEASEIAKVKLQLLQSLQEMEETLVHACSKFKHLMSLLPLKCTSLADFVEESAQSLKDAIDVNMNDTVKQYGGIDARAEENIQSLIKLLNTLLLSEREGPYKMLKDYELESQSQLCKLKELVLNEKEKLKANKAGLTNRSERLVPQISVVKANCAHTVDQFKKDVEKISNHQRGLGKVISVKSQPLITGMKEKTLSVREHIQSCSGIVNQAEQEADHFVLNDERILLEEVIESSRNEFVENVSSLVSNGVSSVNELSEAYAGLSRTMPLKLQEVKNNIEMYKHKEDEVMGIFLEKVELSSSEALQDFDSGKNAVKSLIHSELSHDFRTGCTPGKKSDVVIPELASLPSPIMKVVESRVKNVIAFHGFSSKGPRKHLMSSKSLQDFEDESPFSDSEMASPGRKTDLYNVRKASSISDLRGDPIFQRPRIPKRCVSKSVKPRDKPRAKSEL